MHKTSLYTEEYIRFEEYEENIDLFFEMCLLNIKFDIILRWKNYITPLLI